MQVQEKLKNSSENFWEGNVKARNNNTMGVKKIAFTDAFNSTNVDITYCRRVNECITYRRYIYQRCEQNKIKQKE